jgi:erythromycin esterase-like protein
VTSIRCRIGGARFVLIGAASYGTAEFNRWRAELTKRLLAERGFAFVGVDGDWPDCHRLHCCAAGAAGVPNDPAAALWGLRRWPRWLWANEEVVEFAAWLRELNAGRRDRPAGFHGLDVHRRWDSLHAVLDHLGGHEPRAAAVARRSFEASLGDPRSGARAVPADREAELARLLARRWTGLEPASLPGLDPAVVIRQNAELRDGAERHYRELVAGGQRAWNARAHHLADTLTRLADAYGPGARAIVWAHNTHAGDVSATDLPVAGLTSLGRLVRERHGRQDTVLVGFGTYEGSVLAADRWDGPVRRQPVPPAAPDSVEHLWHEALSGQDGLAVFPAGTGPAWAGEVRGHRAVGVVSVGAGDYVPTVLHRRYDAFIHCDRSVASTPLHRMAAPAR